MKNNGSDAITSNESGDRATGGFLRLLRAVALIAGMIGAVGSVGLMLRAGQSTPRLLLVFFVIWVVSPFVALLWTNRVSRRWSAVTRVTLYGVTLLVTLGSLAIYGELINLRPPGSANAFLFVAVPPASWMFMTIVVSIAALISRRSSQQGAGA